MFDKKRCLAMSRSKGSYMLSWRNYLTCILYATLISTVSGVGEADKPAIVGGISSPIKSLGESAALNCTVANKGNLKVYWRQDFNNNVYDISSGGTILASNSVGGVYPNNVTKYQLDVLQNIDGSATYRLTIHRLSELDTGMYICALVALRSTSPSISENVILTIRGVTSGPKIVYDIGQVKNKIGESAVLSCVVAYKGSNPVKWIRKGTNEELSLDSNIIITNPTVNGTKKYTLTIATQTSGERFDLTVNRLTKTDGDEYECRVMAGGTQYKSKTGTLSVLEPPLISSPNPENITLEIGGAIELTCTATGSPLPPIVWQRVDFYNLPNNQQTYRGSTINIVNVNKEQRGLYRCQASNSVVPDAERIFRVMVEFSPTAQAVHANISQATGFPVTIGCSIEGYPQVTTTWYKLTSGGRTEISESPYHIVTHTIGDGINGRIATNRFSLRIEKVTPSDYGQYQCEGVSPRGSRAATITITQSTTCQGSGCPISRSRASVVNRGETTTCKGDCTGGSQAQHYLGSTYILLVMTIFISLYSNL